MDPDKPVSVQSNLLFTWGTSIPFPLGSGRSHGNRSSATNPTFQIDDLKDMQVQVDKITEWLKLAIDERHLLKILDNAANLGVLMPNPVDVGKATLVRAVRAHRKLIELDGPEVDTLITKDHLKIVAKVVTAAHDSGDVLLVTDIDAALPASIKPAVTRIIAELHTLQ